MNNAHQPVGKSIGENPNNTFGSVISLHIDKKTVSPFTKEVDRIMSYPFSSKRYHAF